MPDLRTLGALIHASPVFFTQYRVNRRSFLAQALHAELGDELFVDVYAAFKSRASKIGPRKGPNSNVSDFLRLYHGWRSPGGARPAPIMFLLDDLRWMAWFYSSTVRPLAAHFVAWSINSSSAKPATPLLNDTGHHDTSMTERTRLLRAFYRLEVFCHLFGGSQYQSSGFRCSDMSRLFFSEFNPWEVEEIGCVYTFIKERYEQVIAKVKWDFDAANPKFGDGLTFEPEGSLSLGRDHDEFLNGTIGQGGLRLAFHMFRTEKHDDLVGLMKKALTTIEHDFFREASSAVAQCDRRIEDSDHGYSAKEIQSSLVFTGDDSARPPLAWVLLWGGKYSDLYGEYVPSELRQQGYVIWDERRLDVRGTKEYFARLWDESPELGMVEEDWPLVRRDMPESS